jgi:hypothetical protein
MQMIRRVHGLEMETTPVVVNEVGVNVQGGRAEHLSTLFLDFLDENLRVANRDASRIILPNQGQVYLDGGHIEICTPECTSFSDLVLHKRIARKIVAEKLKAFAEKQLSGQGVDAENGIPAVFEVFEMMADILGSNHPCGCHENFQICGTEIFEEVRVLLPFLIARKILEGTGFFCTASQTDSQADPYQAFHGPKGVFFCISQRLPFMDKVHSGVTTSNRPIICTRTEALASSSDASSPPESCQTFERRQILIGEFNQSPFCDFVKIGSISLLWEMMEEKYFDDKEVLRLKNFEEPNLSLMLRRVNKDFQSKSVYELADGSFIRLCEILEIYANWMLDYLEARYEGEKDNLYFEKLEVAKKIINAADFFRKGDIFALDKDVDWIIKLRWMQDYIEEAVGIEIGDDEISDWVNLGETLRNRWGEKEERRGLTLEDLIEKILWRQNYWHHLGPKTSFYQIWEDCGLVNPLTINGQEIDLKEEMNLNMNKAPMNPPNRSYTRKQIADFMKKLGLEQFLSVDWEFCKISHFSPGNRDELSKIFGDESEAISGNFPWGRQQLFKGNPANYDPLIARKFIEAVQKAIPANLTAKK